MGSKVLSPTFEKTHGKSLVYLHGSCVGIVSPDDSLTRGFVTSSIILDPFSEFLFWRMNWHIEHHMYASVPCYNLKALHKVTATHMPKPRTLIGAWREMRATWLRQQEEPGVSGCLCPSRFPSTRLPDTKTVRRSTSMILQCQRMMASKRTSPCMRTRVQILLVTWLQRASN
eukprot:SAG31_NODE_3429_length_4284_cov_7.544086_5_plen_172_part_00